jgi:D-proline reductase (dithiol) PrdB
MGLLSSDLGRELRDVYEKAGRRGAVRPSSPDFGEPPMVVLDRPVSESTVGRLVSLGARAPEQLPLAATNDLSFHVIPQSVPTSDLAFDHRSPVRYWADRDLNVAFPRDRLAELASEGTLGALAPAAIQFSGPSRCGIDWPPKLHRRSKRNSTPKVSISLSSFRSARVVTER